MRLKISILLVFFLNSSVKAQDYLNKLQNGADFNTLASRPLAQKYGQVSAVKLVYDIKQGKMYYVNGHTYHLHYNFCEQQLNYTKGLGNFIRENYSNKKDRAYLLANLNYFKSLNKYILDLSVTDQMSAQQMFLLLDKVKETSFLKQHPLFLINSPRLIALKNELPKNIKTIYPKDIYAGLTFQSISPHSNTGVLRIVPKNETHFFKYKPTDILILTTVPDYLPPVAGIIVTELQTPLSHVSILGLNRKIPICAYTKALGNSQILQYQNQIILYEVIADTFIIKPAKTLIPRQKTKSKIPLKCNLNADSLIGIEHVRKTSSSYVGSKAANFGELYYLSKTASFKTPECAFAIPFYFYNEHLKSSGAADLIEDLLGNLDLNTEQMQSRLTQIQNLIENTPINPTLITAVHSRLKSCGYSHFRFRSSTNAEDINGFSGAGLYESKAVKLNSDTKTAQKAIQTVWASTWSFKAFSEREYYRINHKKVAMGILVHRSFPNEAVNGVALTKNIYRKNSSGFVVNAQKGNVSVVSQKENVVAEQFICFPQHAKQSGDVKIDIITHSSLSNELLMSETEIQNLANQLETIKRHFLGNITNTWTYQRLGFDVEFKIDSANRLLYIKQIRPYND